MEVALSGAVAGCPALDFVAGGKWSGSQLEDLDGDDIRFVRSRASSPNVHRMIGVILKQRYQARPREASGAADLRAVSGAVRGPIKIKRSEVKGKCLNEA